jgi:hypothetical protein
MVDMSDHYRKEMEKAAHGVRALYIGGGLNRPELVELARSWYRGVWLAEYRRQRDEAKEKARLEEVAAAKGRKATRVIKDLKKDAVARTFYGDSAAEQNRRLAETGTLDPAGG